jgi:hypothetical protein
MRIAATITARLIASLKASSSQQNSCRAFGREWFVDRSKTLTNSIPDDQETMPKKKQGKKK